MKDNTFRVVARNDTATVWLYEEIGRLGVSAKMVADEMRSIPDTMPISLRINSPGGEAFDGIAIYNSLRKRGNVTVEIDGVCASAAAIVAMAGQSITMADNALFMIHQAWGLALGNGADLRERADMLESIDNQQIKIFTAKTGLPSEEIFAMLEAETWMEADKAHKLGFVDKVVNDHRIAASAMPREFSREVPKALADEVVESHWKRANAALRVRIAGAELNGRRDERGKPIPTDDGTGLQVERV